MENMKYSQREINQMKWQVYGQLPQLQQSILVLYQEVKESGIPWEEKVQAELVTMADVLCNCTVLFEMPSELQDFHILNVINLYRIISIDLTETKECEKRR